MRKPYSRWRLSPDQSRESGGSQAIETHLPCSTCGSSDALARYSDGHTYCFSCGDYKKDLDKDDNPWYNILSNTYRDTIRDTDYRKVYFTSSSLSSTASSFSKDIPKESPLVSYVEIDAPAWRGVSQETFKHYGVKCRINPTTKVPVSIVLPWGGTSKQIRELQDKRFYMEGSSEGAYPLFGMDRFPAASASAITVTEGALDAMSAYEMQGSKYPCVSVRSASSAKSDAQAAFDYLNAFEKIYLCFDTDEPGQKALKQVAALFNPNKVYVVQMSVPYKDANDYLKDGKGKEFVKVWWAAKKHRPKGIVESFQDIKNILESRDAAPIATWPFPTLQEMTYGIRSQELNLITAQEKVGKTAFMSCLEHHLIKTTDYGVGIIHLEQSEKRTIQGILNYELDRASHLPDSGISNADLLSRYEKLVGKEGRVHFYKHFGSDDPDIILDVIRYLVAVCGCKFVFLDHITMLVTGFESDDERRKLDYISTRLAMLTRELDFTLFLVSHLNDNNQTRGSRNISKVADLLLRLERNIEAESYEVRNTTKLTVFGQRDIASTGPAGFLWFDNKTYTVHEKKVEDALLDPSGTSEPF